MKLNVKFSSGWYLFSGVDSGRQYPISQIVPDGVFEESWPFGVRAEGPVNVPYTVLSIQT